LDFNAVGLFARVGIYGFAIPFLEIGFWIGFEMGFEILDFEDSDFFAEPEAYFFLAGYAGFFPEPSMSLKNSLFG
jgi:hypothetical protein